MSGLFGTDGVRGVVGKPPLTAATVRRLGLAAGKILIQELAHRPHANGVAPVALVGRDTRGSGPEISRWLTQGFAKAGVLTKDLGVVPTPAISYLVPHHAAYFGAVISASHNPAEFNGVKFFDRRGFKLSTDVEKRIEARLPACSDPGDQPLGRYVVSEPESVERYCEFLRSSFPATLDLTGRRIIVDAANGAASSIAPATLRELGAEVIEIGAKPNGRNINAGCGATSPDRMRREVMRRKAFCGIALDGDADRVLFADERGRLIDGDALIVYCAEAMQRRGTLRGDTVVLTVMSNLGAVEHLKSLGIETVETAVGDRSVTAALEHGGFVLGGENSGHVVFRRLAATGDGLLTALQVLAALLEKGEKASALSSQYKIYPQILKNVRVERRVPLERMPSVQRAIEGARRRLKGRGRILVRYSGTEPLLRILIEGRSAGLIRPFARLLTAAVRKDAQAI